MKKIIFIALLLSTSLALAGLPSEDPVIDNLRSRFSEADAPSLKDLRLGESIFCIEYTALKGNFDKYEDESFFKFRKVDGIIVNDGSARIHSFVFITKGLTGGWSDDKEFNYLFTLRSDKNGDIIGEWVSNTTRHEDTRPSLIDASMRAISYIICPATEK